MFSNVNSDIIKACSYLIPTEDIVWNNKYLANISLLPIEIQNITKDIINARAEFFLYINSCDNTYYWNSYYASIFGMSSSTYSGSGIILNLLNLMKTSSEDGRQIGRKVLEKLKSMVALKNYGFFDFKESFHPKKLSSKVKSKNKDYIF